MTCSDRGGIGFERVGGKVSESQQGWEETTKKFRELCDKRIEQLGHKIGAGNLDPMELNACGQLLAIAFDMEQLSKVFDANVKHSQETMNHVKNQRNKAD